jgi:glycosyltransferase involved in cell wall biosynthesis
MKICIVGPCAAKDTLDLLYVEDREKIKELNGLSGVPVSTLARSLVELSHMVTLVSTSHDLTEVLHLRGPNFELILVPQRKRARYIALTLYFSEIKKMKEIIAAIDAEVVNAHWTYEHAIAALFSKKPCVVTAHDAPWQVFKTAGSKKFWFFRFILSWLCRLRMRDVIFVSQDLKYKWQKEMLWRIDSQVIPNISPFEGIMTKTKSKSEGNYKIISIGDNSARKNIQGSIDAFRTLKPQHSELELHLVGVGLDKSSDFYNSQKIDVVADDIYWHGYLERSDLIELMKSCHVLVQPSLLESFGLTLIEAMCLGVPVVAGYNTGAAVEVVGESGILVDTRNTGAIVSALSDLLENPNFRDDLIELGKAQVLKNFSKERVTMLTLDEYLRVIAKHSAA